jgi:ribosomal protein L40E
MAEFFRQQDATERKSFSFDAELQCPHCQAEYEEGAQFCGECGMPLSPAGQCPSCKAVVPAGADICEKCGTWLLEGKCKFCYAPLEDGAKFCGECGNPVDGIRCPKCGNLSYFDFCKHCDLPLTEQAREMIKNLEESEELRSLVEEDKKSPLETPELMELKQTKEDEEEIQKEHSLSDMEPLSSQNVEGDQEEVTKVMGKLKERKFKNNQEARRFFGALKVIFSKITKKQVVKRKKIKQVIGWRCYAYNNVHPEGPQGCAKPEYGGEWIFETTTIED